MVYQIILLSLSISVSHLFFKSRTPLFLSLACLNLFIQYSESLKSQSSSLSILGSFIPGAFLNYSFSKPLQSLILLNSLIFAFHYISLESSLFTLCLSFTLSSILFSSLSSDFNKLQQIYSYYRKSDLLFQNIWQKSPFLTFLVDKKGKILLKNLSAEDFTMNKVSKLQTEKSEKSFSLDSFLEIENFSEFLEKIFKDEEVEEEVFRHSHLDKLGSLMDDGLAFLVKGEKVRWGGAYCAAVYSTDISLFRSRRMMMIESMRMVQINTEKFFKQVLNGVKAQEAIDNETFAAFYSVSQLLRDTLVLKSRFFCKYEPRYEQFDVTSEIINIIEILYLKACRNNVAVVYTKEQGIPPSVIGDKILHFQVIYSLINLILESSTPGSEVQVFLQVYVRLTQSLVKYDITLNYKFSFKSDKITNVNVESMFMSQNYHCSKDLIHQSSQNLNKYGLAITASNSILLFLRGNIGKVHSESDMNKVTINLTLPFNTGKRTVSHPQVRISQNMQENGLTTRWKPASIKLTRQSTKDFSADFEEEVNEGLVQVTLDSILVDMRSENFVEISALDQIWTFDMLNAKAFVLVVSDLESAKTLFPENFVVVQCLDCSQASDLFSRYFQYKARFDAILVSQVSAEVRNFSQMVKSLEKDSYLKTNIFYFKALKRSLS